MGLEKTQPSADKKATKIVELGVVGDEQTKQSIADAQAKKDALLFGLIEAAESLLETNGHKKAKKDTAAKAANLENNGLGAGNTTGDDDDGSDFSAAGVYSSNGIPFEVLAKILESRNQQMIEQSETQMAITRSFAGIDENGNSTGKGVVAAIQADIINSAHQQAQQQITQGYQAIAQGTMTMTSALANPLVQGALSTKSAQENVDKLTNAKTQFSIVDEENEPALEAGATDEEENSNALTAGEKERLLNYDFTKGTGADGEDNFFGSQATKKGIISNAAAMKNDPRRNIVDGTRIDYTNNKSVTEGIRQLNKADRATLKAHINEDLQKAKKHLAMRENMRDQVMQSSQRAVASAGDIAKGSIGIAAANLANEQAKADAQKVEDQYVQNTFNEMSKTAGDATTKAQQRSESALDDLKRLIDSVGRQA